MSIHAKNQCIFEAFEAGEINVLVHQVNCQRAMGSGIAGVIRSRYPAHYQDYMRGPQRLGSYFTTSVDIESGGVAQIAGIFGQLAYGVDKRHTNYAALISGLCKLMDSYSHMRQIFTIGIPHGIGCGLGGGDWDVVEMLLNELGSMYSDRIVIYKKP